MRVKVTLKGLKPDADAFETHTIHIDGVDNDEIDQKITEYIYEWRSLNGYYKVKYTNKVVISCDN